MIKRKNILAENMLRFRSKNIAAEEAAAIRKLIEQQTTVTKKYKNPTDIKGFFNDTAAGAIPLAPQDVATVIFATRIGEGSVYGAVSGETNAIQLPGTNLYLAVGRISTVSDNVKPVVTPKGTGAILFGAVADGTQMDPKYGAYTSHGRVIQAKFIPFDGNDLAKFANDIVRATGVRTNKVEAFSGYGGNEKQIAAVLKASANLGITGADKLEPSSVPTSYYATWKKSTNDYLSAA